MCPGPVDGGKKNYPQHDIAKTTHEYEEPEYSPCDTYNLLPRRCRGFTVCEKFAGLSLWFITLLIQR